MSRRLVVDPDATVSTAGHLGQVADHVALEIAGRGLHRRHLGAIDGLERRVQDPVSALERAELLAPDGQSLRLARDLLGVDRVGLDPGPGVGLVVAGALEGVLLVADLDLQALPGARLLGDRPERLEGAGLLLDLQGGGVALRAERLARLLADESVQLGGELIHPGDVRLLARRAGPRPSGSRPARASRVAVPWRPPRRAARPPSRIARAGVDRSRRPGAGPASGIGDAARRRRW